MIDKKTCSVCAATKTYVNPNTGKAYWYKYEGKAMCYRCRYRLKHQVKQLITMDVMAYLLNNVQIIQDDISRKLGNLNNSKF